MTTRTNPLFPLLTGLLCAGLFMTPGFAADDDSSEPCQGRRGPPQESLDACVGLVSGDACSFTARNGQELSGTCATPHDDVLTCKPEGHEMRRHMRRFHRDDLQDFRDNDSNPDNE